MPDVPSTAKTLADVLVGIPNAGRRTLLAAMPELAELRFPESLRLCILDAERMDAPAQIALLDELAADPSLNVIFALNKADRLSGLRTAIARTLALLRERGFAQPTLYPTCAAAARLFSLPADAERSAEELTAQGDFFHRFVPGENSLSAYAVAEQPTLRLGSRELTPEQLRLALTNTGVPALAAALEAREQIDEMQTEKTEDAPAGAAIGRPHEADASEPEHSAPESAEAKTLLSETDPVEERIDAFLEYLDTPENAPEAAPEAADSDSEAAPDPLKELLEKAAAADCAGLLELARQAQTMDASEAQRNRALDVLHEAYLNRQVQELDELTRDAEELDLNDLRALADRIASGPYTVQTRTPYAARITRRIDELQSADLAELCAGIEEADARALAQIRAALSKADCADVLKTEHYQRIEARQDALDLEALDRVTAGAEEMNEKELRALAVTLEANNWSPKYVAAYRHKIDLLREVGIYREVQNELADLDDMERREVLALRERIAEKELPARFTANAAARVDEKLYRLDMLRLMALNNDLERLDFDGIDELRAVVARGDYCERARKEYLGRLLMREKALILENTSARAELTRQLIAQHKLRMSDFVISTSSRDYQARLEAYWGGTGLEQPRDIPVFLFDNASDYAMSGSRFYYKAGRDLAFAPIENIDHFQVMRQHLSLNLQIVGKDNSYRLTEAKISRGGSERTLEFLNDCVRRWAEPGPAANSAVIAEYRQPRLDAAVYTAPVEPEYPTADTAGKLFADAYRAAGLREGNLVQPEDGSSVERLTKMRANLGLPQNTPVVWYASASRLGPMKEGTVVGRKAIYLKEGKQPLRSIPMEEISEIRAAGSKRVTVTSLRNETLTLEISDDMVPLLSDYVRTVQLGDWLRSAEEKV